MGGDPAGPGGLVLLTGPAGGGWRAAADDRVVAHLIDDPEWARAHGIGPAGAVLIRPDGQVAWRCAGPPPGAGPVTAAAVLAGALDMVTGAAVVAPTASRPVAGRGCVWPWTGRHPVGPATGAASGAARS